MAGSTKNIEAVARAICANVLDWDGKSAEKLSAEVDMCWHIVAAELEAGIIDETGEYVDKLDWTRKTDAYRDWMWRHPESREAWKIARFGAPLPCE